MAEPVVEVVAVPWFLFVVLCLVMKELFVSSFLTVELSRGNASAWESKLPILVHGTVQF